MNFSLTPGAAPVIGTDDNADFSATAVKVSQTFTTLSNPEFQLVGVGSNQIWDFSGDIHFTGTYLTNVPIFFEFDAGASAQVQVFGIASGNALVDGLGTFGIPAGVAVFDLPDGFTVNAPSIELVNGVIPADATPEPGTVVFMVIGILASGAAALRRKRAFHRIVTASLGAGCPQSAPGPEGTGKMRHFKPLP